MKDSGSELLSRLSEAAAQYEGQVLLRHRSLREADLHSRTKIAAIRTAIEERPPSGDHGIQVLATAGSLARLEASDQSDLDLIIVTGGQDSLGSPRPTEGIKAWRDTLCGDLGIEKPNKSGVFHEPTSGELLKGLSGAAGESYSDTAKRVLFLLESQWLFGEAEYDSLLDAIVDQYAKDVEADPRKNFVFLLNDVVRYFRHLCVNYQYTTTETADGKWPIRNVKLRHSRVMMYFSMISAIGLLSRERDEAKIPALKTLIRMHPLKRLFVAYWMSGDSGFYRVAGYYNTFISLLSDKEVRKALHDLDYQDRYQSSSFAQLKANSDALSAELLRFFEARRATWDERFFEYMIL